MTGPDDHRCEPLYDADGELVAVVRAAPDLTDRERQALAHVMEAAKRQFEADCAADPSIGERQAAAVERIRGRNARLLGTVACTVCTRIGLRLVGGVVEPHDYDRRRCPGGGRGPLDQAEVVELP